MKFKKYIPFLIFIIFIFCSSISTAQQSKVIKKVKVGMNLTDFFKIIPKNKLTPIEWQYKYKEKIGNLDGEWVFDTKDNRITWFVYSYNTEDFKKNINYKVTYDMLLKETNSIITDFKQLFGNLSSLTKTKPYKNPFKEFPDDTKVYEYEILKAEWAQTAYGGIDVEFFMYANKGAYWMNVCIRFNKNHYLEK